MIDTWLFAAFCLFLLTLAAVIRVVRIRLLYDRILAAGAAIILASAAGLVLSISQGSILILDLTIIGALLAFAAVIGIGSTFCEVTS